MAIAFWDRSLSVSIPEIDIQHKKWIDLLNALHDAMKAGKSNEIMNSAINSLMAYTQIHFKAEERFMQQNNYSDFANHKLQHDKFVAKVQEFRQKYESGKLGLSLEVMQYLSDWFINHIKKTDMQYAKELNTVAV